MAKRVKKIPQKEKLLEIPVVDVKKKDRRKIVKQILPDPFPLYAYGTPCRKEDLFSVPVKDIAMLWQQSEPYRYSKKSRIINEKTFFLEFLAYNLNGESVPGVSSGKIGLLFETVTKILQANEKQSKGSPAGRKNKA